MSVTKSKQAKGEYGILIRFTSMSDEAAPKCWYSYPYHDRQHKTIDRFKALITTKYAGLVEWAAIVYTTDIKARAGRDKHLHTFKKWPNGTYAWLSKEQEDYLLQKTQQ